MLPDGLIELIRRVMKEDTLGQVYLDDADLWKDFTWGVFLDGIRINAEVTYIRNTLWNAKLLDKDWILNHTQEEWENEVKNFISNKIISLDGRKKGALNGLISNLSTPAKSLKESAHFFKDKNVSPEFLRDKEKTGIEKFIGQMTYQPSISKITGRTNPDKIFNIALVKIILWLQGYGLTKDICPPSRQIKEFVDYDIKHLTWLQKKQQQIQNLSEDWTYISHMKKFNDEEVRIILPEATTRDTGIAVWYWKIAQGLLKGRVLKDKLTPKKLLVYLNLKKMSLDDLIEQIDDIDEVDSLASDVKDFLQNNP